MIKLSIIVPVYNCEHLITKCLDSIELLPEIEIIIINDCSTDNSRNVVKEWINKQSFPNISFINNSTNLGVGAVVNKGYNTMDANPDGYVLTLCDDDYLLLPLTSYLPHLTGDDLVYYNLQINNGDVWDGITLSGSSKAYKKSIIGKTRRINQNFGGDAVFYEEILKKEPTKRETGLILYHYNFPRDNSLMNQWGKKWV